MAAPQVTGAVALLKAIKPSASIGEIKDMLLSTVDQMDGLIGKVLSGGKLNLAAATAKILGIPYSPNVLPMGSLTYINLNSVSGWVKDGNNASINLRLIIDGTQVQTMVSTGNFIFSLGGLAVGGYTIEVVAQDTETGVWVSIGKGSVVIPPPVVKVSYLSLSRISGWAYSERSGASPVVVKVIINGRVVAAQWANLYKSGLPVSIVGANHGFNISLNRSWFRRGPNDIRIQIFDPVSKQTTLSWVGRIRK
jgi:hypothetical protein